MGSDKESGSELTKSLKQESNILCHPEDMKRSTLLNILEERCLDIPNLSKMELVDLIQVYNEFLLPLPQRQAKDYTRENESGETEKLSTCFKRKALISDHQNGKKAKLDVEVLQGDKIEEGKEL